MSNRYLPAGCIKPSALFSLASAMNRLYAWHRSHGGPSIDEPCLRAIEVDSRGQTVARVYSGHIFWELILKEGDWQFTSEAVK